MIRSREGGLATTLLAFCFVPGCATLGPDHQTPPPDTGAAIRTVEGIVLGTVGTVQGTMSPTLGVAHLSFPTDPADSLWRAARLSYTTQRFEEAARLFGQIRARFPASKYVPESFYYQAEALFRTGTMANLLRATDLLREQGEEHPRASSRESAKRLTIRIQEVLAHMGDPGALDSIRRSVEGPCDEEAAEIPMMALNALQGMDPKQALLIVREILKKRDHCSVRIRKLAVESLQRNLSKGAVDIILDLAYRKPDPDLGVRTAAVSVLSRVKSEEAIEALGAVLHSSPDSSIQRKALYGFRTQGGTRRAAVLGGYLLREDAPLHLRESAIGYIIGSRSSRSNSSREEGRKQLKELYPKVKSGPLREKIVTAVARAGPRNGHRAWLIERIGDLLLSPEIRMRALDWGGGYTGPWPSSIGSKEILALYGALSGTALKREVMSDIASRAYPRSSRTRTAVPPTTQRGDTALRAALIRVAKTEKDRELRRSALQTLLRGDDGQTWGALAEVARTEVDSILRRQVVTHLATEAYPRNRSGSRSSTVKEGNTIAVAAIIRIAQSDRDLKARTSAIHALLRGEGDRALGALTMIVRTESDLTLRRQVVQNLAAKAYPRPRSGSRSTTAKEGNPLAVSAIVGIARNDKDLKARQSAIQALFRGEGDRALTALTEIARMESDSTLRRWVVDHLATKAYPRPRSGSRSSTAKEGNPLAVAAIIRIARTEKNLKARQSAIQALLRGEGDRALDAVVEVAKTEKDTATRRWVVEGLLRRKGEKVVGAVIGLARIEKDRALRRSMIRHLGNVAYPSSNRRTALPGRGTETAVIAARAQAGVIEIAKRESDLELKRVALSAMYRGDDDDRTLRALADLVKKETDVKVRLEILQRLGRKAYPGRSRSSRTTGRKEEGDSVAISAFLHIATTEKNLRVRKDAIGWMYYGSDEGTITALIEVARSDPDIDLRKDVLRHLTKKMSNDPRVAELLLDAIKGETIPLP